MLEGVQVHRNFKRYPTQCGRTVGRRFETNPSARDQGQKETEPTKAGYPRIENVTFVTYRQGNIAKNVFARLKVQILRQPSRALSDRITIIIIFITRQSFSILSSLFSLRPYTVSIHVYVIIIRYYDTILELLYRDGSDTTRFTVTM